MARHGGGAPRLSIVVPATDVAALEDTLVSVLENRPADTEIVAAPGTDYDDPWNIQDEVRFVTPPAGTGLIGCINLGVAAARAPIVHVLAAGCLATDGWTERALSHFGTADVGAVAAVGIASADRQRVVSTGVRRTRGGRSLALAPRGRIEAVRPSAPALEAGFWRASILHRAGGFTTDCGDDAAADMSAALSAAGLRTVLEPSARVVWGPAPRRRGGFLAGLHAERLFWRSLACERPLAALPAHLVEIARHAVVTAPLETLPMLAGRLVALCQFGSCMPRARQLAAVARESAEQAARTIRIDAAHPSPAAPRHRKPAATLRRSA